MKIVSCKWFPPSGFAAINLFGVLIVKNKHKKFFEENQSYHRVKRLIYHESIHTWQMRGLLYIPFYLMYFIEWFIKLFTEGKAYKRLSFEREAKLGQDDYPQNWKALDSLKHCNSGYIYEKRYSRWYKYIFHQ